MNEPSYFFGTGASFQLSYTVLKGNSGIFKIRVLPCGTLFQTLDIENFASANRSPKCAIDSARQGGRSQRDILDCRRFQIDLKSPYKTNNRKSNFVSQLIQFMSWSDNKSCFGTVRLPHSATPPLLTFEYCCFSIFFAMPK